MRLCVLSSLRDYQSYCDSNEEQDLTRPTPVAQPNSEDHVDFTPETPGESGRGNIVQNNKTHAKRKRTTMTISKEQLTEMLQNDRFPRSAKYDPEWVLANEMGPQPLWTGDKQP
jgi:hypothetical protein